MFILLPKIHSLAFSVEVPGFLQSHQSHTCHPAVSLPPLLEVTETRVLAWLENSVINDSLLLSFMQYFVGTEMNDIPS